MDDEITRRGDFFVHSRVDVDHRRRRLYSGKGECEFFWLLKETHSASAAAHIGMQNWEEKKKIENEKFS